MSSERENRGRAEGAAGSDKASRDHASDTDGKQTVVLQFYSLTRARLSCLVAGALWLLIAVPGEAGIAYSVVQRSPEVHGQHVVARKLVTLPEDSDIWGLAFSPNGRSLATFSPDSFKMHVWDWRARRIVRAHTHYGALDSNTTAPVLYSPHGRYLAECHGDSVHGHKERVVISVWSAVSGASVYDIAPMPWPGGACQAMAFTPDGRRLIEVVNRSGLPGDTLVVYSTRTWKRLWGLRTVPFEPQTLAVSPDGKRIALGGETKGPSADLPFESEILIVDLARRAVVRTIAPVFAAPPPRKVAGRLTPVVETPFRALAWSPDGQRLAAGTWTVVTPEGPAVRIFDARTGALLTGEPAPLATGVWALRYSTDGQYLVESLEYPDGPRLVRRVEIWDGRHRRLLRTVPGRATAIALSTHRPYLLAIGGRNQITVWALKSGQGE